MKGINPRLKDLFKLYAEGSISEGDSKELWDYLNDPVYEAEIIQLISADFDSQTDVLELHEELQRKILNYIYIEASLQHPVKRNFRIWMYSVAAASIVIFGLGYFLYANIHLAAREAILPGKNGATLTLANGRKLQMDNRLDGIIAVQSGVKILKNEDGQIIYETTGRHFNRSGFNTLSTNNGQQFKVQLSDGSLVYLNAKSSLKFPISFISKKERRVELIGEGYFEVAKDRYHPFIVETANQRIEVLGTHFNVDCYRGEISGRTTLLEGRVKIIANHDGKSIILVPGQQSVLTSGVTKVIDVNVKQAVDWKDGKFVFNAETLGEIMKKVERWYNVQVTFEEPDLSLLKFSGTISRYDKISKLLDFMEATGEIRFGVTGNKIQVSR